MNTHELSSRRFYLERETCYKPGGKEIPRQNVHPDNPFNEQEEEDISYSKELGMLSVNVVETPRNIFCYVKRSNRTLSRQIKKEQEEEEKCHGEAVKIVRSILLV